jgi:uncharacterized protein (TIGR00251 family)
MGGFLKQGPKTMVCIIAHPNKPKSGIIRKDVWDGAWHVWIKAGAQKNQANQEIEKLCSSLFGAGTRIVHGKTSSRKTLEVSLEMNVVEKKLEEALIVK